MDTRLLETIVLRPDGTPWAEAVVAFTLLPGSYLAGSTFPSATVTATAGADGRLSVGLWVNAAGLSDCVYLCRLPSRESFTFTLPAGAGPADLSALRTDGDAPVPTTTAQSLIDAHAAAIASAGTLGHVRVGSGLAIDGAGVLSATGGTVSSVNGQTGAVILTAADIGAAPLASPALTGAPTAPTAPPGTTTTQIATTAFAGAGLAALVRDVVREGRVALTIMAPGHGWVSDGAGTFTANDTTDRGLGTQCATLTTTGGGAASTSRLTRAGLALDLATNNLELTVKIDNDTNAGRVRLYVGTDGFDAYYTIDVYVKASDSIWQAGRWQTITINLDSAVAVGAPNPAALTSLRLNPEDDGTGTMTLRLGGVALIPKPRALFPRGVVSWSWDDGWESQWTIAAPKLAGVGHRATAFLISDTAGAGGYCTVAQLRHMQDIHGWEMAAHAHSLARHNAVGGFTALTAEQLHQEFQDNLDWMRANALDSAAGLWAPPQGRYNHTVLDVARQYFRAARGTNNWRETLPPPGGEGRYKLRTFSMASGSTLAQGRAAVDACVINGSWLILTGHRVDGVGWWTQADFEALVNHVASSGVAVLPLGDVLRVFGEI